MFKSKKTVKALDLERIQVIFMDESLIMSWFYLWFHLVIFKLIKRALTK